MHCVANNSKGLWASNLTFVPEVAICLCIGGGRQKMVQKDMPEEPNSWRKLVNKKRYMSHLQMISKLQKLFLAYTTLIGNEL